MLREERESYENEIEGACKRKERDSWLVTTRQGHAGIMEARGGAVLRGKSRDKWGSLSTSLAYVIFFSFFFFFFFLWIEKPNFVPHLFGEKPIIPSLKRGFLHSPSLKKFYPRNLNYNTSITQTNRDAPLLKILSLGFLVWVVLNTNQVTSYIEVPWEL